MPISDRLAPLAIVLLLGGCGQSRSADPFGAGERETIDCRTGGSATFDHACPVERAAGPDGLILTVRHPDGGFRRLLVTKDGSGIAAADGAMPAIVTVEGGDGILVTIGGDAYRLPATVKPTAKP